MKAVAETDTTFFLWWIQKDPILLSKFFPLKSINEFFELSCIRTYSRKIYRIDFNAYSIKTKALPKKPNNFPINDA